MAAFGAHRSGARELAAEGEREVDAAIAATRRAQALWSPDAGYAALAGRSYNGASSWGASVGFEALPRSAGLAVSIAHSNMDQCRGAVRAASAFFDQILVDGQPQRGADASEEACGSMGQNALRLVKLERREAGADSQAPGAFSARPALAPSARQLDEARSAREAPARGAR